MRQLEVNVGASYNAIDNFDNSRLFCISIDRTIINAPRAENDYYNLTFHFYKIWINSSVSLLNYNELIASSIDLLLNDKSCEIYVYWLLPN